VARSGRDLGVVDFGKAAKQGSPAPRGHRYLHIFFPKGGVIPQNFLFGFAQQRRKTNLCGISFKTFAFFFNKGRYFNEIPRPVPRHGVVFPRRFAAWKRKFCGMTEPHITKDV
jgi:hypothetical protein